MLKMAVVCVSVRGAHLSLHDTRMVGGGRQRTSGLLRLLACGGTLETQLRRDIGVSAVYMPSRDSAGTAGSRGSSLCTSRFS